MTFDIHEASSLKSAVHNALHQKVLNHIDSLRSEIAELQAAANEETKSSAGDKYETGRAMAQLEIEKLSSGLNARNEEMNILRRIDPMVTADRIQLGSLVETSHGLFFLSINGGVIKIGDHHVTSISLLSPLGKSFLQQSPGGRVDINGRQISIKSFY